jgi:hypothetical protein
MSEETAILNAKGAIARHMQWRMTLQLAITLEEPLAPEHIQQIRTYRRCAIGRWLDSEATAAMRQHPAYVDLCDKHVDFHREMDGVAKLIEGGRYAEAARAIDPYSSFAYSSKALALAITAYDRIATIAVPV